MTNAQNISTAARSLYACLQKRLGRKAESFALNVELQLAPGITILFGASGAGKTTLLDCLAGLVAPDEGRITLGDAVLYDSEQRTSRRSEHRRVGYLFQDLALFPHLTALQNVEFGLAHLQADERRAKASAMLRSFKVEAAASRKPRNLSGGERQRVALARALVAEPDFLLLDEPLTGLDAPTKRALVADLRLWNARQQVPILYVTHDRDEVYALGDRVIVLEKGSVTAEGTPHQVLETPEHESVAQLAGFENVFDARVVALHPQQGTMTCQFLPRLADSSTVLAEVFAAEGSASSFDPVVFEAPLIAASVGTRVRIGLRAGDILIATERPHHISARNILPATIQRLQRRDVMFLAEAKLSAAPNALCLEVHLTPGAVDSLGLSPGTPIWLVIKTHSCRVLKPAR